MNITAGIYKGRKLEVPDSNITRPTLSKVRMGVFNTLYSIIGEFDNLSFLDVFGGSGIMGLEALSRGFKKVTIFEKHPKAANIIKNNYNKLNLTPNLLIGDSTKLISNTEYHDVIYIDPPYSSNLYIDIIDKTTGNIIILEHSTNIDLSKYKIIKEKNYGDKLITFLKK